MLSEDIFSEDWMHKLLCPPADAFLQQQLHVASADEDHAQIVQPRFSLPANQDNNIAQSELKTPPYRAKKLQKLLQPIVALQTRSDTDVLDDGYKWRKYGMKAAKNSKHPRSYYRCTIAGCLVKKRVERSTHDPDIVVTTYQGRHNHYHRQYSALHPLA